MNVTRRSVAAAVRETIPGHPWASSHRGGLRQMTRKSVAAAVRRVIPGKLWADWHRGGLTQMYSAKTFESKNLHYSIVGFNSNTQRNDVRYLFYPLLLSDLKSYRFMVDKISDP